MAKVIRDCTNCAFYVKLGCRKNRLCNQWLFEKASCMWCTNYESCNILGRETTDNLVCTNFDKAQSKIEINKIDYIDKSVVLSDADLYNPLDLIDKIIESGYDSSSFELVDDCDIIKPSNMVLGILDPNILNIKLYPRQLSLFSLFLNSHCPWCSDTKLIATHDVDIDLEELMDHIVFYINGVCPKCKRSRYDAFEDGISKPYNQLIGLAGQRSGKSASVSMLSAIISIYYLKLPNPVSFFGLLPNSVLHGTFVGLRYSDAFDNLWEPYYNLLTSCPWFKTYHKFLDSEGERLGVELYKLKDSFVSWTWKSITCYPSGPDKRKLRGRSRFLCLSGDTYIDTDKGLITLFELNKYSEYPNSFRGNEQREISKVMETGFRKDMVKITLENGITIKSTSDHKFVSVDKTYIPKWRKANALLGYYVPLSFDTKFPDLTRLRFKKPLSFKEIALRFMNKVRTFTLDEVNKHIFSVSNQQFRGTTALTSRLRKDNLLTRKKQGVCGIMKYTLNENVTEKNLKNYVRERTKNIKYPKYMSYKLGWILGSLVSDGNYYGGKEITYCSTNVDKINVFVQYIKDLFNVNLSFGLYTDFKHNTPYYVVRIGVRELKDFFIYLGLTTGSYASIKKIPWCIMQGCKESVTGYILSSIIHDGGIGYNNIRFSSTSEELLQQFSLLSLKLGLICEIRGETLKYSTDDSKVLQELIINTNIEKYKFRNTFNTEIIRKRNLNRFFKVPYFSDSYGYPIMYNREGLDINHERTIPDAIKLFIKNTKNNWVWVKVSKIEETDPEFVYDLTVNNKDHIFTANGINTHNSSIDELCWFTGVEGSQMYDPDEVYTALDNSLMTIDVSARKLLSQYPDTPFAYGMYISSPRTKTDKGMRMFKQSKGSNRLCGFQLPTWEFNPNIKRKDLDEKWKENPDTAERDFGAVPPFGMDPFISNPASLIPIFSKKKNVFNLGKIKVVRDSMNKKLCYPMLETRIVHSHPSVLAIDAGFNNNSFSLALMHKIEDLVCVSGLIEIKPSPYPLSFPKIYENVIEEIIKNFNIKLAVIDRWQSINLTQQIFQTYEIDSLIYSVKYDDFENLRSSIMGEEIILPKLDNDLEELINLDTEVDSLVYKKPSSHLFLQFLMSNDTGRTVTKGDSFTDDLLRSVVLGHSFLLDEEYDYLFNGVGTEITTVKTNEICIMLSKQKGIGLTQGTRSAVIDNIGFSMNRGLRK